jgi:Beta propeller domain
MLPPGISNTEYWNMLVSNTKLILVCHLMSGQNLTVESVPMSWLVVFELVNATVMPTPRSALVPGMINYVLEMDHCQAGNGKGYLRFVTTRFVNLVDFFEDLFGFVFPSVQTYLQILEFRSNDYVDGDSLMPVVGELALGSNGTATSAVYKAESVILVAQNRPPSAMDPTTHAVYTIDTTDPSNPLVVGEMILPVTSLNVYDLNTNWLVGISSFDSSDEYPIPQPLQLFLWNTSSHQGPTQTAAYHWIDDAMLVSNGTGINSTISQAVSSIANWEEVATSLQYIEESKALVLPVSTVRYEIRPCTADDPRRPGRNQSFFNYTCQFNRNVVFDGFWVFKVDLVSATPIASINDSSDSFRNITKHFEVNHASPDLLRQECVSSDTSLSVRSLAFHGDVMTFKRNAILSHDLLTRDEAAPVVILGARDC